MLSSSATNIGWYDLFGSENDTATPGVIGTFR